MVKKLEHFVKIRSIQKDLEWIATEWNGKKGTYMFCNEYVSVCMNVSMSLCNGLYIKMSISMYECRQVGMCVECICICVGTSICICRSTGIWICKCLCIHVFYMHMYMHGWNECKWSFTCMHREKIWDLPGRSMDSFISSIQSQRQGLQLLLLPWTAVLASCQKKAGLRT